MHSPDPILTASIYCNRRLDAVIHGVVAPALGTLRAADGDEAWGVWWVRYSRNGDHLKVRLHGPEARRDNARRVLAEAADAFFAALPPAPEGETRVTRPGLPAIDREDEAAENYPDRALLWTTYQRSHVSFGPRGLLGDDAYVGRMVECLRRGADLVLQGTLLDPAGAIPGTAKQRVLLRAVVGGIAAAGLDEAERAAYLAYHRGWLVRFSVPDGAREEDVLAGFDRQVAGMPAAVEQIRRAALPQWAAPSAPGGDADGRWRRAVGELRAWAAPIRRDPDHLSDPFTDDALFPLLFKALHGVANQAGHGLLNEAYVHHLLLHTAASPAEAPVLAGAGA